MEEKGEEPFSVVKRAKSFTHAGRGAWILLKTTHNAWVQLSILAVAVAGGLWLRISQTEWMLVVFAAGLVLAAEGFNTAIEIDIDLTSPEFHPYARDTKDVAAGAVLIASAAAALIGLFIFVPRILSLL